MAAGKGAKSLAWLICAPLVTIVFVFVMLWPVTRSLNGFFFGGLAIFAIIVFTGGVGICLGVLFGIGAWQRK